MPSGDFDPAQALGNIAGLSVGQELPEMLLDQLGVTGPGLLSRAQSSVGQVNVNGSAVVDARDSFDEVLGHHPVDQPRQAAWTEHYGLGQIDHTHPAFRCVFERKEHIVNL